ncbi:MAG: DUF4184 family protein [Cardiobacteriaceae bacterium]|nr:DUF4184 family protein [Cardiobacteriaceae bacterium]
MPFTLAHPAAVLPLARSRLHFPALVLGSMSPDFLYFLQGRPASGYGHTLMGCILLNLPLVVLLYALYRHVMAEVFWKHLPDALRVAPLPLRALSPWAAALRFALSAFLGMATHVFWDGFTHQGATFVDALPWLQATISGLALYKWLQYGGGVLGLAAIAFFWRGQARRFPAAAGGVAAGQKWRFWLGCAAWTLAGFALWSWFAPLSWRAVATQVVRFTDCAALALLWMCVRNFLTGKRLSR